jgi:hypothetical protein
MGQSLDIYSEEGRRFLRSGDGKDLREDLWDNLPYKLLDALKEEWPSVRWGREYVVPGGVNTQQWDIGGMIPETRVCVAVEGELARPTAVRNVNKTWMAADRIKQATRLIQIFSPLFAGPWLQRFDEANFIGHKAQADQSISLSYLSVRLETWPLHDKTIVAKLVQDINKVLQIQDEL